MKIVTFNLDCCWDGAEGINSFIHRAGMIYERINAEKPDIIAFQEGRQLTDIEKEKANKKHKWQLPLIVALSGIFSFVLAYLSMKLFS